MPQPRSPPDISVVPRPGGSYGRRVRLGTLEFVGVPLLALLPLLALSGLLGPSNARQAARVAVGDAELSVELSHPSLLRRSGDGELVLEVRNAGPGEARGLVLGLDEAYLARFGHVQALPAPEGVRAGALRFALPPLAAGERASVRLLLEASDWGRLPAWIEIGVGDAAARGRLSFSTLVLP